MIFRLIALWKMRDTPYAHMCELNALLIKAGQRCAYDMRHCADDLRSNVELERVEFYRSRSHMWLGIFDAGDNGKNYRHKLHHEISDLNFKIEKIKSHCVKFGIPYPDSDDIPF